jgi:hypothetical protein
MQMQAKSDSWMLLRVRSLYQLIMITLCRVQLLLEGHAARARGLRIVGPVTVCPPEAGIGHPRDEFMKNSIIGSGC